MEGLIKRTYIVVALVALCGVVVQATARAGMVKRTESWMEQTAIRSVGDFKMRAEDVRYPDVSYKMDPASYKVLQPYGIVARILEDKRGRQVDTVLIASSTKASFHDPRVCFTAQGWQIKDERVVNVPTKTRGTIAITLATMVHQDQGEKPAVFFYKGPEGFAATTSALKMQMLKVQLLQGRNPEGVFYRFMPLAGMNDKELLSFVGDYMDASGKATQNYF